LFALIFNHEAFMRLSDTLGVYLHLFIASALKSFRSLMVFVQQTGFVRSSPFPLSAGNILLIMSPRHVPEPEKGEKKALVKTGPSMDRERHLEDSRHHPTENTLPHPPHKTIKKPLLSPKHTPHSHGDELPAHSNPPGPIKPSKKITKTGAKK
jgi:hypothetical protein